MKKILCLIAAALLAFSAAACSQDGEYPVNIASYTFSQKPSSVVCLSDSVADILISCGYADSIKAKSDECTQPELQNVPSVGKKYAPDMNKIKKFEPDVVFVDKTSGDVVKKLAKSDLTVLNMAKAKNSDDLKVLYRSICTIMEGNEKGAENGRKKAASLLITLDDLQRLVPSSDIPITACYLYSAENYTAATKDTFAGKLFEYANLINICADYDDPQDVFNAIQRDDPKYIFCPVGLKDQILSQENFSDVSAVLNNNVYEIDSALFERQGDSMTEVLSFIIETVYPELNSNSGLKPEESKTEQSKAESTPEESKAEQSETESKPEESKAEQSEAESKPEESKAEQSEAESKPEESKAEQSKAESKPEESKAEQSKAEESSKVKADDSLKIDKYTAYGIGDTSDDVAKIQTRLKSLGYGLFDEFGITDYYGEQTAAAFELFQKNNGLDQNGYASSEDLKLLFSADVKPAENTDNNAQQENP